MNETVIVANSFETKTAPAMGKFERYLTLWVALCINPAAMPTASLRPK
jgi:hypothetical protein